MKILIPLLDDVLKKEDLTEESGFIDAFVYDKNRPYIDNCIFLMFAVDVKNKVANERDYRMRSCKNIQSCIIEYINGRAYKIYAFPLIDSDIKKVFKGFKPSSTKNVARVLGFWLGCDNSVNLTMLDNAVLKTKVDWKTIPEYDYLPDPFDKEMGGYLI